MLRLWRESLKEQWASGSFQADDPHLTARANLGALCEVTLLQKLADLEYSQIEEMFDEQ